MASVVTRISELSRGFVSVTKSAATRPGYRRGWSVAGLCGRSAATCEGSKLHRIVPCQDTL